VHRLLVATGREAALAELLVGLREVEQVDDAGGVEVEALEPALEQRDGVAGAAHAGEAEALERGPGAGDGRVVGRGDVAEAGVAVAADAGEEGLVGLVAGQRVELVRAERGERLEVRGEASGGGGVDLAGLVEAPLGDEQPAELGAREPLALEADGLAGGGERQLAAEVLLDLPVAPGGDRTAQVHGLEQRAALVPAADQPRADAHAEHHRRERRDLAGAPGDAHEGEQQEQVARHAPPA
jgi:hypothetical protein